MADFAGFRRREAHAINSGNLAWSDISVTDMDYIAARGMSGDPLGAALERLKWANDFKIYAHCVRLLGERFFVRKRRNALKALCHTAVREWIDDNCRKCGGRGIEIDKFDNPTACAQCNGSGLHAFLPFERAHMANLSAGTWKKYEKDYDFLLQCLNGAVASHRIGAMKAFGTFE